MNIIRKDTQPAAQTQPKLPPFQEHFKVPYDQPDLSKGSSIQAQKQPTPSSFSSLASHHWNLDGSPSALSSAARQLPPPSANRTSLPDHPQLAQNCQHESSPQHSSLVDLGKRSVRLLTSVVRREEPRALPGLQASLATPQVVTEKVMTGPLLQTVDKKKVLALHPALQTSSTGAKTEATTLLQFSEEFSLFDSVDPGKKMPAPAPLVKQQEWGIPTFDKLKFLSDMSINKEAERPSPSPFHGLRSMIPVRDGEFINLAPQQLQTSRVSFGPFVTQFFDSKLQSRQTPRETNESILFITESSKVRDQKRDKEVDSCKMQQLIKCHHKDRKIFSMGLCQQCYQKASKQKKAYKCEHNDSPHYANGLCQMCYLHQYYQKNRQNTKRQGSSDSGASLLKKRSIITIVQESPILKRKKLS